MTLRNGKLTMTLAAAAVAFALGTTSGFAQQAGSQGAQGSQQQGAQQPDSRQSQQPGAQQTQQERSQQQRAQQQRTQQQGAAQSQSGSQQQGGQRAQQSGQSGQQQGQSAANQQRGGDSRLDQVVQMHSEIGTFVQALEQAGLVEELAGSTNYTIFAPTNEAFESMDQDVSELLRPENREELVALLRAHIVADDVDAQRARQLTAAQTLDGETIELSTEDDKLMVGEASVVTPDIEVQGSNLTIHSIDQVLGEGGRQLATAPDRRDRG